MSCYKVQNVQDEIIFTGLITNMLGGACFGTWDQ